MTHPTVPLGQLAEITSGFAFKSELFNTFGEGLPLVRIRDVVDGVTGTYYSGDYKPEYIVENDDALIGMDGQFNLARWRGGKALLNQRVCKVKATDSRLDQNYLLRFLPSALKDIEDKTPFVTVKHLSVKSLREMEIPLPPLSEQRHIAATLDKADALRVSRSETIVKYDQLLQSVFLELFGDPSINPFDWPVCDLGDMLISGPQNGLYKPSKDYGSGTPILRIDGFSAGDIINTLPSKRVSLSESEIKKYELKAWDIVINRVNSPSHLGKAALVTDIAESTVFESNMMRMSVDATVIRPIYLLKYLTQQFVRDQIATKRKDAINQSSINQGDVQTLRINVPPVTLQEKFEKIYIRISRQVLDAGSSSQMLNVLFESLQHRSFTGKL